MKKQTLNTLLITLLTATSASSASAGCSCPSGYKVVAGASVGSASAKVCRKKYKKTVKRKASCDLGFKLKYDVYGKKDQCKSFWGYGATIPQGTTGLIGHASNYGWVLNQRSRRDFWTKTKKHISVKACIG